MAKKDKKKPKKQPTPADPVGAVRTAVERTFQATADSAQSTRTRAQDLVDEVAGAAGRLREMIEDTGVAEDLKGLRTEVEALSRRVAALEAVPATRPARAKPAAARPAAAKPAAARPAASGRASGGRAASPRAAKPAASGGRAAGGRASGGRASTAKPKPAAKPRSSAPKKPAA